MNKLRQIIYDMRHQPVVVSVTLLGTTLAIFLMMVTLITMQVSTMPYAPESNRPLLLYGENIHIMDNDGSGDSSGWLGYKAAKILYEGLDGIEMVSYFNGNASEADINGPTGEIFPAYHRGTDAAFWRIYDHTLVKGRYYTAEEVASNTPVAVVSESTARRLAGSDDPIGKHIKVNHIDHTITGVVKDHTRLALRASGDVFTPVRLDETSLFGDIVVGLLMKPGVDPQYIRDQVKGRYATLNTELSSQGKTALYHGQPYTQEIIANTFYGSNTEPDIDSYHKEKYISLLILLVLPAINLSSMLNSRMRRRVSEFGIRRAFGCTRSRLYFDIISENLLMTIIGGIVGLALSIVFAYSYNGLFAGGWDPVFETPALSVLLNWRIIGSALLICFVLNLISASLPAWKACRVNIVNAINSNK